MLNGSALSYKDAGLLIQALVTSRQHCIKTMFASHCLQVQTNVKKSEKVLKALHNYILILALTLFDWMTIKSHIYNTSSMFTSRFMMNKQYFSVC